MHRGFKNARRRMLTHHPIMHLMSTTVPFRIVKASMVTDGLEKCW